MASPVRRLKLAGELGDGMYGDKNKALKLRMWLLCTAANILWCWILGVLSCGALAILSVYICTSDRGRKQVRRFI